MISLRFPADTIKSKRVPMNTIIKQLFIAIFILIAGRTYAGEIRVGIARKIITPQTSPIFLTGFANREKPATGVLHDLWAKAIVLEESPQSRVIIVTTDILGLSHEISENVSNQIIKKYRITRSQLLLNSSHTHSGPMIWPALSVIAEYSPEEQQVVSKYSQKLTEDLVTVIDMAIGNIRPMQVSSGHGSVNFAMNRRQFTDKGVINGINPNGPVDHDVPVLKVASADGIIQAVLFGYACHNTTIGGDNYLINGDYAGFAQIELEKAYKGATAMFLMGCAGDQNPQPRGTFKLAENHGRELALAVQKVLAGQLIPVRAPIRTDYAIVNLEFPPLNIETYQKDIIGSNKFLQRRAELMLQAYNKGWNVNRYPYPVQAIRFGKDLTILALGGETVVEYSLKAKKQYDKENLFMAGYSNEVMCYIPAKHMLAEGGYEPESSMIYYGMPGPFADNVEDKIFGAIHRVMKNVGAKSSGK
jgi:neutral ceramidase